MLSNRSERIGDITLTLPSASGRAMFPEHVLQALRTPNLWWACLIEVLLWMNGAVFAYWQIPDSFAAIRSQGVEIPRSMIRAIEICDWIAYLAWVSLPLLAAFIVVPKLIVFSRTSSWGKRAACVFAGWAVPLVLLYYVVGTPAMIKLGLWP